MYELTGRVANCWPGRRITWVVNSMDRVRNRYLAKMQITSYKPKRKGIVQ